MINFACPSCKSVLKAAAEKGGCKVNCPRCGQRLLVPLPAAANKTILGLCSPSGALPMHPRQHRTRESMLCCRSPSRNC